MAVSLSVWLVARASVPCGVKHAWLHVVGSVRLRTFTAMRDSVYPAASCLNFSWGCQLRLCLCKGMLHVTCVVG